MVRRPDPFVPFSVADASWEKNDPENVVGAGDQEDIETAEHSGIPECAWTMEDSGMEEESGGGEDIGIVVGMGEPPAEEHSSGGPLS